MKSYKINIAEIVYQVSTDETGLILNPHPGYKNFLLIDNNEAPDIAISVKTGKPNLNGYRPVFNASLSTSAASLWKIYKFENHYCLNTRFQEKNEVYAMFDISFSRWDIFIASTHKDVLIIDPFSYPLGPIIMLYSTLISNGVMIHASGIRFHNKGLIFCGVSGSGKTTISEIFKNAGAEIINDDRLIIRRTGESIFNIYNTPMYYTDKKKQFQLNYCFFLEKSEQNSCIQLSGTASVARFSASCLQHNFHKDLITKQIDTVETICNTAATCRLGFVPDKKIISYVEKLINP